METDPESWAGRQIGRMLGGRYRLERVLGVGGMGAVFAATHVAVGRAVAVKVLLPEVARDRTVAKRFHGEARAAAAVGRRGVVDVLDFDVDTESGPYLVMEHLDGEPLSKRIARRGRLDPDEALRITSSLLRTLGVVHAQDIVHRDLKPDNVFLAQEDDTEVVKVLDFGISRVLAPERQQSAQLTRPGAIVGTPVYMSPEQARGEPGVDRRTDLYAVGAILYEALSGRPPYEGSSWQQVFASVLTEPPPSLRELRPELPSALHDVVETAMARDAAARFESADAMREAVEAIGGAPPTATHSAEGGKVGPPSPAESGRVGPPSPSVGAPSSSGAVWLGVIGVALLLGIAGLGGGVWLWVRAEPSPPPTEPVLVSADGDAGVAEPPDTSDAGTLAALGGDDGGAPTTPPPTGQLGPSTGQPAPTGPQPGRTLPPTGPAAPPSVVAKLEGLFERAERARRAGRRSDAKRLYEDVIRAAWDAQVPMGDPAAKLPARARMALGDLAAQKIDPIGPTRTSEDFNAEFREVTGAYSKAAQHYGRVGNFGHMGLTQCGLVRSAEASEQLRNVVRQVRAPREIVKLGPEAQQQFESGFRQSAKAYLETASGLYEAAGRIPNGDPKCRAEARRGLKRVLRKLGRRVP